MTEIKFRESFDGMYKRISKLMNLSVKFDLIPTTHFQNVQDLTLTLFHIFTMKIGALFEKKENLQRVFLLKLFVCFLLPRESYRLQLELFLGQFFGFDWPHFRNELYCQGNLLNNY